MGLSDTSTICSFGRPSRPPPAAGRRLRQLGWGRSFPRRLCLRHTQRPGQSAEGRRTREYPRVACRHQALVRNEPARSRRSAGFQLHRLHARAPAAAPPPRPPG